MKPPRMQAALAALALCGTAPVLVQAQPGGVAPAGTRATLTVEYRFEAQGRKQDKYDLHEWKLARSAELVAELQATKPSALPAMQPLEAAQTARIGQQQAQAQRAATQMAPMMASAQAIIARCGDDEKCIERETMQMGAALAGTQQLADTQRTGRETAAVMQAGADRYQRWEGRTQKGSYVIDENWHVVHADPICVRLPKARCTHDLRRQGRGVIAAADTAAAVEVDLQANTLVLSLPVPHTALAYVETQTTDEPEGTHSTVTPKGPQNGQMPLRLTADGQLMPGPLKLALKGAWRSQAGEQVIPMAAEPWHGAPAVQGQLVMRWRFSVK